MRRAGIGSGLPAPFAGQGQKTTPTAAAASRIWPPGTAASRCG